MKNEKQKNTNEKRLSRKTIISLVAVVLVFAAVSVAMIPLIRLLSSEHGQEIIIEKMQSFGIFAPLLFVLLQVLQVVVAVIPGGPVPIIGGILFGQWGGLFLSLAGFFLGTVLVYYLVQWIGRPLVDRFVPFTSHPYTQQKCQRISCQYIQVYPYFSKKSSLFETSL